MTVAEARYWEQRVLRAAHPLAYPGLSVVANRPARRVPGVGVVVTDPALLRAVLTDTTRFSKTGRGAPSEIWTPVLGPSVLFNMDGEAHSALRRRLGPMFAPAAVRSLADEALGAHTAAFAAALSRGETVDVVTHGRVGVSAVIARLLGVAIAPGDELYRRLTRMTAAVTLTRPGLRGRALARARAVMGELGAQTRRAYRGDESTVPGRMRALGLGEEEAVGAVGAFLLAGTETLTGFLPRLTALLIDSGWLALLGGDDAETDAAADAAIEEALRVTAPTPVMLRSAVAHAEIGGVDVRPGDRIVLATLWATRGFGEAAAFDPDAGRTGGLKRLWFGAGQHYCLGAPLAMAQIGVFMRALRSTPGLQVVAREPERRVLIPGYRRLEVHA